MQRMSWKLDFEKLHNIRDLGGMKSNDGSVIRDGCFVRAGYLSELTDSDRNKLKDIVSTVIDFRSDQERVEKPDVVIDGISYIHIPIVDSLTAGVTREKDADKKIFAMLADKPVEAKKYMCEMYRGFATESAVAQYSRFIRLLFDKNDKAILWHCTAGKDRAGVASVIIEEILGIRREAIIADYMATNKYLEEDIVFLTDFVKKQLGTESNMADEALRYLFGAEEEYIGVYYETIDEKYGSFSGFIKDGIGLSEEEVILLKDKYTC